MSDNSSRFFLGLYLLACFFALSNARKIILKIKDEDRIVNGQNATIDQIPWIVQIVDKYAFGGHGFICGGTIVSPKHIVTASHCFKSYNADDLAIVANATFLERDAEPGAIRRDVAILKKHPKYDAETDDNDIAVLVLKDPLPLGKGVKVAEMCEKSWKGRERIIVSGWGHLKENDTKHSNQLQIVKLETMAREKCLEEFEGVTERMACSVVSKGKDACQGDSGGPAFYDGKLCGVVSFGFGCGQEGNPAIFASIPKLRKFIDNNMKL